IARCGVADVVLTGKMRGPFCEGVRTLAAEFDFRTVKGKDEGVAEAVAVVTDPCKWTEERPHLYDVEGTAPGGEQIADEYRGKIGLRRLAPRRPVDFAPGTG